MSALDELKKRRKRIQDLTEGANANTLGRLSAVEGNVAEAQAKLDETIARLAKAQEEHDRLQAQARREHEEREAAAQLREAKAKEYLEEVLQEVLGMADSVEAGVSAVKLHAGDSAQASPQVAGEELVAAQQQIRELISRVTDLEAERERAAKANPGGTGGLNESAPFYTLSGDSGDPGSAPTLSGTVQLIRDDVDMQAAAAIRLAGEFGRMAPRLQQLEVEFYDDQERLAAAIAHGDDAAERAKQQMAEELNRELVEEDDAVDDVQSDAFRDAEEWGGR